MKIAFYTLGCKVNQYETDLMTLEFKKAGFDIVDFSDKADIYVVNSCSVTNLSTRKTRQQLSKAKRQGGIVVLVGCYAEEVKQDTRLSNVDLVLGNEEKKDIVNYVKDYLNNYEKEKSNVQYKIADISKVKRYVQKDILDKGINIRESVKIEDGCNNFCTYCIIPYLRGRVRSRNIDDIEKEVKELVKNGTYEIVLVGIEIASYGKDLDNKLNLVDVIEKISKIDGLKRIRLSSIEPRILTDENIIRMSKIKKLCPHFHISVQSLNNNVLKNMNRKYTKEFLLDRINTLRKYFDDPAITCDIIVGFPKESDEDFLETLNTAKQIGFYEIHVFRYSKRKYTLARDFDGQIDGNIKNERSRKLLALANDLKMNYMKKYLGKKVDVLFELYKDGYLYGYTSNYIKVKVKGDKILWGSLQEVELDSIEEELILGSI